MEMAKLIDQVYILQQENGKQQAELSDHQSLLRQEKDETRKLRNQHKELLEQMDALKGTNTKQEQCIAALNKRFSRLNNDKLFTVTDLKRQLVKANVSLSKEQLENERLVSESMRLKDRIILLEESAAKIKAIDANQNDSNCSTSNDPQETDSEDNRRVHKTGFESGERLHNLKLNKMKQWSQIYFRTALFRGKFTVVFLVRIASII